MAAVIQRPERFNEAKAAEYLGIAAGTLRNWRWRGPSVGPKYIRIGSKLVRYDKRDLDAFMQAGAVGGESSK